MGEVSLMFAHQFLFKPPPLTTDYNLNLLPIMYLQLK